MMKVRLDSLRLIKSAMTRDSSGFTLTEVMVALLIMVLLTAIVANGIPVAYQTYLSTVKTANAQVALSMTTTELRSELGVALTEGGYEPKPVGAKLDELEYCSNGFRKRLRNPNPTGSDENGLMVAAYDMMHGASLSSYVPLVPKKAITGSENEDEKLTVKYDEVTYSSQVISFINLRVEDRDNKVLASAGTKNPTTGKTEYKIRAFLN